MNKAVKMSILKTITGLLIAAALTACGGGGGDARTPVASTTPTTSAVSVASILLSAPSSVLSADGTSSTSILVRALDSSGGLLKGAALSLSVTGGGLLDNSVVTTDSTGSAHVILSADQQDQRTRTATVTASCSCTAPASKLDFLINGASLTLTPSGSTLSVGGGATVTAVVTKAGGGVLAGALVTFSTSDPSKLSVSLATVATNTNGVAQITVTGGAAGSAILTASVLQTSQTQRFTVNPSSGGTMTISYAGITPINQLITGIPIALTVSAPGATNVSFVSSLTQSVFSAVQNSGSGSSFGAATNLTVSQAGTAVVTALDNNGNTATIQLTISPPAANKLVLNALQTTVGIATSANPSSIRITATAFFNTPSSGGVGANDQLVANVPVAFSMSGGPNAGEYLSPVFQLTDSSGNAYADFYPGTQPSITPVVVTARIVGSSVQTNVAPSSNDLALSIGGQALSVAFGASSTLRQSSDNTLYYQDYSVLVTDANNNPVSNSVVTLNLRPVAFSLGGSCTIAATYCSEDANGNGSKDAYEDGMRFSTTVATVGQCPTTATQALQVGSTNLLLTPLNSQGGIVPSTVKTDATGTASFTLTYLKGSALWVIDKLTATVSALGTESGSSVVFRLPASVADFAPPSTCFIPDSPFAY